VDQRIRKMGEKRGGRWLEKRRKEEKGEEKKKLPGMGSFDFAAFGGILSQRDRKKK
jgi:hypothetical protein